MCWTAQAQPYGGEADFHRAAHRNVSHVQLGAGAAHLINGPFGQLEKWLGPGSETKEIGNHVKNKEKGSMESWHCEMKVINSKQARPECHRHQGQALPCSGKGQTLIRASKDG